MKFFTYSLFILLCLEPSSVKSQTWVPHWQSADFNTGVEFFQGENFGYACFDNFLYKLNDFGNSSEVVYLDPFKNFLAIDFSDTQNGWALMEQDFVWSVRETSDGGVTWIDHGNLPGGNGNYSYLEVINDNLIFASTINKVFRSTDNGETWTEVLNMPDSYTGLHVQDNGTLWISGGEGKVYKSINNGQSWTLVNINVTTYPVLDIQFIGANNIYALIGGGYGGIRYSTNGGANWSDIFTNVINQAMQVIDSNNLLVSSGNSIIQTTNAGTDWTTQFSWTGYRISYEFFHPTASEWILTGFDGQVYYSNDNGTTWEEINSGVSYVTGIDFINANEGWIVGGYSGFNNVVAHTINAGTTWHLINVPEGVSDINFHNSQVGYSIGNLGIHRTTDGGASWELKNASITSGKLVVVDDQNIHILSNSTTVHNSFNGGDTWSVGVYDVSLPLVAFPLYDLEFTDPMNGRLSGDSGYVYFTSNGGVNWIKNNALVTSIDIPECFYITSNIGWHSTLDILYKTTNGGSSWTTINVPQLDGYLSSIHFYDTQNGMAVDSWSGEFSLMETSNGGTTWTEVTPSYMTNQSLGEIWRLNSSQGFIGSSDLGILKQDFELCPLPAFTATLENPAPQACVGGNAFISFESLYDIESVGWYRNGELLSNLETLILTNVDPGDAGIYECHLTNTNVCGTYEVILEANLQVLFDVPPIITITTTDQNVCEGESVTLSASSNFGFIISALWFQDGNYLGQGEEIVLENIQPFQTGIYHCECTVSNVCGSSSAQSNDISITVSDDYDLFVSFPVIDEIYCEGQPFEMNPSAFGYPAIEFEWVSNGLIISNSPTLSYEYLPADLNGTLSLTISGVGGCTDTSATQNYLLNVYPLPNVYPPLDPLQELFVCPGETITLNFNADYPADFYEWYVGEVYVGSTQSVTITLSEEYYFGEYHCTPYYGNECGYNFETFHVYTISPGDNVEIIPNEQNIIFAACGEDMTLSVSANIPLDTYEWTLNGNVVGTEATLQLSEGDIYEGTYYCTITASNDCGSDSETFLAYTIIIPEPYPLDYQIENEVTVCTGQSATLSVNAQTIFPGVVEYIWWLDGEVISTADSFDFLPQNSGIYIFTCEMSVDWACGSVTATEDLTLYVFDGPTLPTDIFPQEFFGCAGDILTLNCDVEIPDAEMTYEWTLNDVIISNNQNIEIILSENTMGDYYCNVTAITTCGPVSNNYPLYNIYYSSIPNILASNDSTQISICEGSILSLQYYSENTPDEVTWFHDGNNIGIGTELQFEATMEAAGEYTAIATSSNACGSTTVGPILMYTVSVQSLPALPDSVELQEINACEGSGATVSFLPPIDGATYEWSFDGQEISPTTSSFEIPNVNDWEGWFYCTVTLNNSCGSVSQEYTVAVLAIATIIPPTILINDEWMWTEEEYATYEWYLDGELIGSNDTIANSGTGSYELIVTNSSGCSASESFDYVGVNETENEMVMLFPNPSSDKLYLQSSAPMNSIVVYDSMSRKIMDNKTSAMNYEISVDQLSNGVYWIKIHYENKRNLSRRFVVQK